MHKRVMIYSLRAKGRWNPFTMYRHLKCSTRNKYRHHVYGCFPVQLARFEFLLHVLSSFRSVAAIAAANWRWRSMRTNWLIEQDFQHAKMGIDRETSIEWPMLGCNGNDESAERRSPENTMAVCCPIKGILYCIDSTRLRLALCNIATLFHCGFYRIDARFDSNSLLSSSALRSFLARFMQSTKIYSFYLLSQLSIVHARTPKHRSTIVMFTFCMFVRSPCAAHLVIR